MAKKTELKPIARTVVKMRLVGLSPLITHKWSEKAKSMMRDKQQTGKKTKNRENRDPQAEGEAATYYTEDGKPGVLAVAIKDSIINAAHNDLGFPKTLVRKALFVRPMGREVVLPIETASGKGKLEWGIEEDMVRVGQGSADLRYRPYFYNWAVTTEWELDGDLLQVDDLLTLVDRAGFGVGIHEWRPEKGGEYGRFAIDASYKMNVTTA